ncbi:MAG: hypothetical protein AVDCRST_MAG56-1251, partial [uncultured Cytophagales bacterium]
GHSPVISLAGLRRQAPALPDALRRIPRTTTQPAAIQSVI